MKPTIGVIPLWDEKRDSIWMVPGYMEGIQKAGGIPMILPFTSDKASLSRLVEICDGFLFTGGQDINPDLYGKEKSHFCGPVCSMRDDLEKKVFELAVKRDKPVFGICRGIQFMNVYYGGTLYQDLEEEYNCKVEHHMEPPYDRYCHAVDILSGTPLEKWLKCSRLKVNSYHHQAVDRLAQELLPMAISEDGLIEAVFMPEAKFIVGVQWHPEFMYKKDAASKRLFQVFVEACM